MTFLCSNLPKDVVETIETLVMEPAQLAAQLQRLQAAQALAQKSVTATGGGTAGQEVVAAGGAAAPVATAAQPQQQGAALRMAVLTSLARLLEAKVIKHDTEDFALKTRKQCRRTCWLVSQQRQRMLEAEWGVPQLPRLTCQVAQASPVPAAAGSRRSGG